MRWIMKNLIYLFLNLFLTFNSVFAFEYSEQDKDMFYDAFIDGYMAEITKNINQLDIEQSKKDKFISSLKNSIDRQNLINSSWDCIKKYPIQQIVSASVICTEDWNNNQIKKNKEIFDLLD